MERLIRAAQKVVSNERTMDPNRGQFSDYEALVELSELVKGVDLPPEKIEFHVEQGGAA
jgi:hypothetical protein